MIVVAAGNDGLAGAIGSILIVVGSFTMVLLGRTVGLNSRELGLDERQRAERDQAHVRAYRILAWAMMIPLIYGFIALRKGLWLPETPKEVVGAFAVAVIGVGLIPLSLISWQKPDAPVDGVE